MLNQPDLVDKMKTNIVPNNNLGWTIPWIIPWTMGWSAGPGFCCSQPWRMSLGSRRKVRRRWVLKQPRTACVKKPLKTHGTKSNVTPILARNISYGTLVDDTMASSPSFHKVKGSFIQEYYMYSWSLAIKSNWNILCENSVLGVQNDIQYKITVLYATEKHSMHTHFKALSH